MCVYAQLPSHIQLFVTPWTLACQAHLSVEIFRQEYWTGLPFPSQGDSPNPGNELVSLASLFAFLQSFFCLFSRVQLFVTPWTVAHQAPLSMGSFRQE